MRVISSNAPNALEIGDETIHAVAGALMGLLIFHASSIEIIAPGRHMPVEVAIIARLTVDDLIDFLHLIGYPAGPQRASNAGPGLCGMD
jgi:hypothetical protein